MPGYPDGSFLWTRTTSGRLNQTCRQQLVSLFAKPLWDNWEANRLLDADSCDATPEGLLDMQVRTRLQRSQNVMLFYALQALRFMPSDYISGLPSVCCVHVPVV